MLFDMMIQDDDFDISNIHFKRSFFVFLFTIFLIIPWLKYLNLNLLAFLNRLISEIKHLVLSDQNLSTIFSLDIVLLDGRSEIIKVDDRLFLIVSLWVFNLNSMMSDILLILLLLSFDILSISISPYLSLTWIDLK